VVRILAKFVAAAHIAKNLGIPFEEMKMARDWEVSLRKLCPGIAVGGERQERKCRATFFQAESRFKLQSRTNSGEKV
jgi:hypothetical protein